MKKIVTAPKLATNPPMSMGDARRRVLFFAEDVTLAHVGRMIALAQALDSSRFETILACGSAYRSFAEQSGLKTVHLETMGPAVFAKLIDHGAPIFPKERLQQYVAADLALMTRYAPDLVVGDFRCSLGISAELASLPSYAVSNGVWSPFTTLRFPVPEHPLVSALGVVVGGAVMRAGLPFVLGHHLAAFNTLRRSVGLSRLTSLQEAYTLGTRTLYADVPELAPTSALEGRHEHVGPILWEPSVEKPSWWETVPNDRPIVYVNLGSSGSAKMHQAAIDGLAHLPVTVLLATLQHTFSSLPKNVLAAKFLPGIACAKRANVVVCNGGSGTIYQALNAGVPVLGLPSNADQHLCTEVLVAQGAGRLLRAGTATPAGVEKSVQELLTQPRYAQRARELQAKMATFDAPRRFAALVEHDLGRDERPRLGVASSSESNHVVAMQQSNLVPRVHDATGP